MLCLHVSLCTSFMPGSHGGHWRMLDLLELDLQMSVMLEIEPGSSRGAVCAHNHWTTTLAFFNHLLIEPLY